jgi:hypothetical protein
MCNVAFINIVSTILIKTLLITFINVISKVLISIVVVSMTQF